MASDLADRQRSLHARTGGDVPVCKDIITAVKVAIQDKKEDQDKAVEMPHVGEHKAVEAGNKDEHQDEVQTVGRRVYAANKLAEEIVDVVTVKINDASQLSAEVSRQYGENNSAASDSQVLDWWPHRAGAKDTLWRDSLTGRRPHLRAVRTNNSTASPSDDEA